MASPLGVSTYEVEVEVEVVMMFEIEGVGHSVGFQGYKKKVMMDWMCSDEEEEKKGGR